METALPLQRPVAAASSRSRNMQTQTAPFNVRRRAFHLPQSAGRSSTRYVFKRSRFSSHSRIVEQAAKLPRPARVLDVGGGEGFLSARLREMGHEVMCLAEPGTVADGFPLGVCVIETDLNRLRPVLNTQFDLVVCGDVLEHLVDPAGTLQWLAGLLAPDGVIVGSLPNGVHLYVRLNVLLGRFPKHNRGLFDRTHLHFFSLQGWRELFETCALDFTGIHVTPLPLSLLLTAPIGNSLEKLAFVAALVWKQLLAYQFIVTARRVRS
jgi:SAM-dependent methyltransferase